jgi:hypothetical protein
VRGERLCFASHSLIAISSYLFFSQRKKICRKNERKGNKRKKEKKKKGERKKEKEKGKRKHKGKKSLVIREAIRGYDGILHDLEGDGAQELMWGIVAQLLLL